MFRRYSLWWRKYSQCAKRARASRSLSHLLRTSSQAMARNSGHDRRRRIVVGMVKLPLGVAA
jgi:hypothetical protein